MASGLLRKARQRQSIRREVKSGARDVLLERHRASEAEIQWRAIQRDALVVLAFTLVGLVLGNLGTVGVWAVFVPLPLMYLASIWMHHDRRIGSVASYRRNLLEPAMAQYDQLPGLERYLDETERDRAPGKRIRFSAAVARLLFPTLQAVVLVAGLSRYDNESTGTAILVLLMSAVALAVIVLTFMKVKHERRR